MGTFLITCTTFKNEQQLEFFFLIIFLNQTASRHELQGRNIKATKFDFIEHSLPR